MRNVYFISIKSQLKQTSRLMKAIVEIKLGTRNMFRISHNCLICYCLRVYLLWYFNTNCSIDLVWIFMLCNMVGIFKVARAICWQQANYVEIYVVLIRTTRQVR